MRTGTCAVWGENIIPEQFVPWDEWEGCFCECFQNPSGWRPPVLFSSTCWWRDPLHWIRMIPHNSLRLHCIWFTSYHSARKVALYWYSPDIRSGFFFFFLAHLSFKLLPEALDVLTKIKLGCELPVFFWLFTYLKLRLKFENKPLATITTIQDE